MTTCVKFSKRGVVTVLVVLTSPAAPDYCVVTGDVGGSKILATDIVITAALFTTFALAF